MPMPAAYPWPKTLPAMISPAANIFAEGFPTAHQYPRLFIYARSQVREGNAGPYRISVERRLFDSPRPVGLRRRQSLGTAIVEIGVVECPGPYSGIEIGDGSLEYVRIDFELHRQLAQRIRLYRRKQRWHKKLKRRCIENDVPDLIGLRCNQPAPDGVALGPDILAFVIEPVPVLVHYDAEHDAIEPGNDAAVVFRGTRVDCYRVTLRRVADFLYALVQQHRQDGTTIIGRPADKKVLRRIAPILLQPLYVRLKAAGGGDERVGTDNVPGAGALHRCRQEHPIGDIQRTNRSLIDDVDAEMLGGPIKSVEHGAAAAEKKGICPP